MSSVKDLKTQLLKELKGVKRLAVLGVGSELRGDDAAGMLVAASLKAPARKKNAVALRIFLGCTAPENLTGEIKAFVPTHLLIIDAADMGAVPGAARIFKTTDQREGISFSTHRMPLKILSDYLCTFFPCCVIILGVQPKNLAFGSVPSKEVKSAARSIAAVIADIVKKQ